MKAAHCKTLGDRVYKHRFQSPDQGTASREEVVVLKETSLQKKRKVRRLKRIAKREQEKALRQFKRHVDQLMTNVCSICRRANTAEKLAAAVVKRLQALYFLCSNLGRQMGQCSKCWRKLDRSEPKVARDAFAQFMVSQFGDLTKILIYIVAGKDVRLSVILEELHFFAGSSSGVAKPVFIWLLVDFGTYGAFSTSLDVILPVLLSSMIDPVVDSALVSFSHALASDTAISVATGAVKSSKSTVVFHSTGNNVAEETYDFVADLRALILPSVLADHPVPSAALSGETNF